MTKKDRTDEQYEKDQIDFYYYDLKPDKKDDKKDRTDEQYEKDQIDWNKSDIAMKDADLDRLQAY